MSNSAWLQPGATALCLLLLVVAQPLPPAVAAGDEAAQPEPANYSRDGADTCLRCHGEGDDSGLLEIFRTPHGNLQDSRTPMGQLQCESCHGPGGAHAGRVRRGQERPGMIGFGQGSETPVEQQNSICLDCHQAAAGSHWGGSAHDSADVPCADCHQVHLRHDPVLDKRSQPQVCYQCHAAIRSDTLKFSAHPLRQGKMACSSCHQPHGSVTEFELTRESINDTCFQCHAELRGPYLWEHAPASEDCSLCHRSHGSNHTAMLRQRAPLLCQQCHSQAGHPSLARSPAGIPARGGSTFLSAHSCVNCHTRVHGSNHPSGAGLRR